MFKLVKIFSDSGNIKEYDKFCIVCLYCEIEIPKKFEPVFNKQTKNFSLVPVNMLDYLPESKCLCPVVIVHDLESTIKELELYIVKTG